MVPVSNDEFQRQVRDQQAELDELREQAAALEDDITPGEKAERLMALQTLQKKITMENNRNRVGRSYAVLVDGTSLRNPDQVHGRTSHNTIVNFPGERSLVGRIAAVRITRANQNSLTGEIVP